MDWTGQDKMTPQRATAMFRRVLGTWAVDALRLRRAGLDVPTARRLMLRRGEQRPEHEARDAAQFRPDDAQERAA